MTWERLSDAEIHAVVECLASGWLTMGPRTTKFEGELARCLGIEHAVALSSATAALHLAYKALGVGHGDHVLVSALARPAAAQTAAWAGAEVKVLDVVSPRTPSLDPADVEAQITDRTRAVVVAHPWGYPAAAMPGLRELCDARSVKLIEDATEALGATICGEGRYAGTIGHVGCLSLSWGTQLGVGQGGVLVTAEEDVAARAQLLRSHSLTSSTWDRHVGHAAGYDVVGVGFNYRIDEPRSALARARLPGLARQVEERRDAERAYRETVAALPGLEPCFSLEAAENASPLAFPVLTDGVEARALLIDHLASRGFRPERRGSLAPAGGAPAATDLQTRALALPLHPTNGCSAQAQLLGALTGLAA